jgi:hypothetical protein
MSSSKEATLRKVSDRFVLVFICYNEFETHERQVRICKVCLMEVKCNMVFSVDCFTTFSVYIAMNGRMIGE